MDQVTQTPARPADVPPIDQHPGDTSDVVDLRFLFAVLWRHRWIFLALVVAGGLYGLYRMHDHTPTYRASMVVAPTSAGGEGLSGRISSILPTFQSLGLSLGGSQEASNFDRLKLVMGSVTLARHLQDKFGLLQRIHEDIWREDSRSWAGPDGTLFEWEQGVLSFLNLGTWQAPSVESLARSLRSGIEFELSQDSGFVEIGYAHPDRDFALWLLRTVYEEADDMLRRQDHVANSERKSYLGEKLAESTVVEMRQALATLLLQEEQTSMMLTADLPYAARVIEPAYVSRFPLTPSVLIEAVLPIALLVTVGIVLIVMRTLLRTES